MCGIVGLLYKDPERRGAVGGILAEMCQELGRRGPDSTGMALYGVAAEGALVVRVDLDRADREAAAAAVVAACGDLTAVREHRRTGRSLRLAVTAVDEGRLADHLEARVGGVRVFSIGRSMEVVKDTGWADELDRTHSLHDHVGTHGIGHTRMATESRVDIAHSHPFWARPFPDVAVVHNGTITNYHRLRRRLELRGHHFATGNDSEVIAVYIADRLAAGEPLADALRASVSDLDGTFAYLIATDTAVGVARDQFATKPLLYAENDEMVLLASEEIAMRRVFPDPSLVPRELQAKEVRWWQR
ncbi:MAG TPA: amidophosphoribosyltransferase [Candidatus Dormibacteraeota bacterium]